ncbi:hypothetical protein [Cupriavidus gilardii]|uniref:glycine-rich domain-containing protein n=1 Tax=Cupriavidus gilardii TaxID=82541 RepID=UPI000A4B02A8|nr:hypothetical protein [Cupriavidus gilardii]
MDYPKSVPSVGLVNGKFVDENAAEGTVGSLIPSAWGNAVTDEVLNVIRAAGLEPSEDELDQLNQAIAILGRGRLLRTSVYTIVAGQQRVSVNGGTPSAAGASTFIPLTATRFVEVEVQGGGGGGGGVPATGGTTVSASGSGGAGSYAKAQFSSGFSGVSVTVGAAGAGGAAGQNNGGNGGTSSFGVLASAPGGIGGQSTAPIAPPTARGGSTYAAPPSGGNLESSVGVAGGGTTMLSGTVATPSHGGMSRFGAGGISGQPAGGPGAGGGGVSQFFNGAASAGGDGGSGIVIVREYS